MCKNGIQGLSWVNLATRMNKHRAITLLGIYLPIKQILQKGQVERM